MSGNGTEYLTGADYLVQELRRKGVDLIFCITGAGNLAIVDALARDGSIKLVYSHHEQAAVMEAQGYSRVTGKVGVALVTTGGGAANSLTGVLSAYLDSIPVLIISGNESSFQCVNYDTLRAYGVQGFDSVTVMKKIAKTTLRVMDASEVINDFEFVWSEAEKDRKGPVLLDFPMDLQRKLLTRDQIQESSSNPSSATDESVTTQVAKQLEMLKEAYSSAERPLLYIGNGCRNEKTLKLLTDFIEVEQIPFCLSWSAADLFPASHELNVGHIGIYGDRATNFILQKADLLLTIGTRLAIPQIGYDKSDFGRNASKWVIEIDPTECLKFSDTNWNLINTDVALALPSIVTLKRSASTSIRDRWISEIATIWQALPRIEQVGPLRFADEKTVHSAEVIDFLNTALSEDAVIATDVGAGLLTGHYIFGPKEGQRFFTSQGLGEMGFGLPGAIGAYFGAPHRQNICLDTDGGIMFNLQELQVIAEHKIPMKLFIFNNDGYSMIKISQENLFGARMAGSGVETGVSFPNFRKLADTFDLAYLRIDSLEDLESKLVPVLNNAEGTLIEVIMSPSQKYLPRLATTKLSDGTLVSPPLEDLDPPLSIDELTKYLGYQPHPNSFKARGLLHG